MIKRKHLDKNYTPLNVWEVERRIYNDLGVLDLYPEDKSEENLKQAYSKLLEGERASRFNTKKMPYLITTFGRIINSKGNVTYPVHYVSRVTGEVKQYINIHDTLYNIEELFLEADFNYDLVTVVRLLRKYGIVRMANHSNDLPF